MIPIYNIDILIDLEGQLEPRKKPPRKNTCYNTMAAQICKRAMDGQALMGIRGACRDNVLAAIQRNSKPWDTLCRQYDVQS